MRKYSRQKIKRVKVLKKREAGCERSRMPASLFFRTFTRFIFCLEYFLTSHPFSHTLTWSTPTDPSNHMLNAIFSGGQSWPVDPHQLLRRHPSSLITYPHRPGNPSQHPTQSLPPSQGLRRFCWTSVSRTEPPTM